MARVVPVPFNGYVNIDGAGQYALPFGGVYLDEQIVPSATREYSVFGVWVVDDGYQFTTGFDSNWVSGGGAVGGGAPAGAGFPYLRRIAEFNGFGGF